jgi:hypothetical protein
VSDFELAAQERGKLGAGFFSGKRGEKTEAPAVDTDDGDLGAGGFVGDPEKGAIATDDAASIVAFEPAARDGAARGLLGGEASGFGEGDEFARELGSAGFIGVGDEGERAEGFHAQK